MNYIFSLIIGGIVPLMVACNGILGEHVGLYFSTFIIHLVGLICCTIVILILKPKIKIEGKINPLLFSGGLVGVGVILCNNYSYSYLSVTAILALSLFGQSLTSFIIDYFEVFRKRPKYTWRTAIGFLLLSGGITIMIIG